MYVCTYRLAQSWRRLAGSLKVYTHKYIYAHRTPACAAPGYIYIYIYVTASVYVKLHAQAPHLRIRLGTCDMRPKIPLLEHSCPKQSEGTLAAGSWDLAWDACPSTVAPNPAQVP